MKGFNVRLAVARSMGAVFYLVLFIIVCGFVMKISLGQETHNIMRGTTFMGIIKGIASFDSDSVFALAAYVSAMSPFLFSAVILFGYLLQGRYKAALLGLFLLAALVLSLFVKSA